MYILALEAFMRERQRETEKKSKQERIREKIICRLLWSNDKSTFIFHKITLVLILVIFLKEGLPLLRI